MLNTSTQEILFTRINDAYERHYFDTTSIAYRDRFIYDPLFSGLDLNHSWVADLACSSGYTSLAVKKRFPHARTWGFELSAASCSAYRASVEEQCSHLDLTQPFSNTELPRFDCAILISGLHHCVKSLNQTVGNVASLIKPGGFLLLAEPNAGFALEPLRKLWYFFDRKYIDHTSERALHLEELKNSTRPYFALKSVHYMGGPAYFFVLNSLILRIPLSFKETLLKPLMRGEDWYGRLSHPFFFPYFLSRWEKLK